MRIFYRAVCWLSEVGRARARAGVVEKFKRRLNFPSFRNKYDREKETADESRPALVAEFQRRRTDRSARRINYDAVASDKFVEIPSKSYLTAHSREISLLLSRARVWGEVWGREGGGWSRGIRDSRKGRPGKKGESRDGILSVWFFVGRISTPSTPLLPVQPDRCSRLTLSSFATLGPRCSNGTHGMAPFSRRV